jgi:uncharacterized Tic20 family protein
MTNDPGQPIPGRPTAWPDSPGASARPDSRGSSGAVPAAQDGGDGTGPPPVAEPGEQFLATVSYVGVLLLGPCVPLLVYLFPKRKSGYVRRHSAQALNLSVTALIYGICVLIVAAMLALDSIVVALAVAVPLAAALWLATLGYVIAACVSARQGGFRSIPGWLCAPIVR